MADLHPTNDKESLIKTSPPAKTNALYRKRPAQFGQVGRATGYISSGDYFSPITKPHYYQLAAWDSARRNEPIIFDGINKIALSVKAKLTPYIHKDTVIQEFVRHNLHQLSKWVYNQTISLLWSGYASSEIIWTRKIGPGGVPQVWIEDVITYHPSQVELKLNLHGRLTHGEKVPTSQYLTGVWVPVPLYYTKAPDQSSNFTGNLVRLPRSKVIHISLHGDSNNPYGTSIITPILKYHLFKEAFRDMMAVALDRYGTPLIWGVVPPQETDEVIQDLDGTERRLSLHEVATRELENMRSETGIIFTQIDKDHPVKLEALTTGNNFADSFQQAIDMCDHNMMRGMSIPNLIMKDDRTGLGTGGSSERQVELFQHFIDSIYEVVIDGFLSQCVKQLIQYNFDPRLNKDAYDKGSLIPKPFRASDIATIASVIQIIDNLGYLNSENETDWQFVRNLISAPTREQDSKDISKIKSIRIKSSPPPKPPTKALTGRTKE